MSSRLFPSFPSTAIIASDLPSPLPYFVSLIFYVFRAQLSAQSLKRWVIWDSGIVSDKFMKRHVPKMQHQMRFCESALGLYDFKGHVREIMLPRIKLQLNMACISSVLSCTPEHHFLLRLDHFQNQCIELSSAIIGKRMKSGRRRGDRLGSHLVGSSEPVNGQDHLAPQVLARAS